MKNTLFIYMYSGIQTISTNIFTIDKKNNIKDIADTRYIVDHVFEIVLPYYEQYPKHDIKIFLDGQQLEYGEIEKSYYDSMTE
jgi:hypothetical protein